MARRDLHHTIWPFTLDGFTLTKKWIKAIKAKSRFFRGNENFLSFVAEREGIKTEKERFGCRPNDTESESSDVYSPN